MKNSLKTIALTAITTAIVTRLMLKKDFERLHPIPIKLGKDLNLSANSEIRELRALP